jgi:hypothetical protein
MEINNVSNNNLVNDLSLQTNLNTSSNNIQANSVEKTATSLSNSYLVNSDITPKRSELSNNLTPLISSMASEQSKLSNLNNQNNILDNIITISKDVVKDPQTLTPEVEQSLNELMSKYQNSSTIQEIANENLNSNSTAYFDGMVGAKPLKLQDMIDTSTKLKESTNNEIKVVEQKIDTIKTQVFDNIENEKINNANLKPNKNIDFGKNTSDFSASNINNLMGSVIQTQANAIPAQSQKLLY